jgi:Ni/Fe-hydrogenase b-type cytochrome subunit
MSRAVGTREPRAHRWMGFTLAHDVPRAAGNYRWVYLWGAPLRAMHWLAVLAIVVLVVTGFYIGGPYFMAGRETGRPFVMGWMRLLHFVAAAVFVTTGIVRLYWMFAGNQFERWKALFPVRPRDWVNMWKQVKYYLMIRPEQAPHYLGHNPLQQLSYTGLYAVAALMVITGFTLYGQADPTGFFYSTFGWVAHLLGGMQVVRFLHHVFSWAFLIFLPIHIYLAIRADHLERTGTISSIISGGRFVPAEEHYVDKTD